MQRTGEPRAGEHIVVKPGILESEEQARCQLSLALFQPLGKGTALPLPPPLSNRTCKLSLHPAQGSLMPLGGTR